MLYTGDRQYLLWYTVACNAGGGVNLVADCLSVLILLLVLLNGGGYQRTKIIISNSSYNDHVSPTHILTSSPFTAYTSGNLPLFSASSSSLLSLSLLTLGSHCYIFLRNYLGGADFHVQGYSVNVSLDF